MEPSNLDPCEDKLLVNLIILMKGIDVVRSCDANHAWLLAPLGHFILYIDEGTDQ